MTMMLAGWGTVGLCYAVGRITSGVPHILHENTLDLLVPFDASAIWLYLSFFILVPAAYLCAAPERLRPVTRAMQLSAVVAATVFVAWPTTLVYPTSPSGTASAIVLTLLTRFDSPQNCLPSLHGALTLLCVVALWQRDRPWRSAFVVVWGLAVMWSIVAARRHLSIDLGAGVLLGAVCACLVTRRAGATGTQSEFDNSPEFHP
ncbi:inositol phosphorylceramide synthase [Paraburkholderia dinghuensis]|uniref:Inositol phosphorylceramide synthase n=2 Tax=Paraburkholderia dinghuensis TaxID=2305225 RepID=A0A3N6PUI8_9BURK|nr:inositol phosphorylceramide synthase [Paraburkholderia dinghuensis]